MSKSRWRRHEVFPTTEVHPQGYQRLSRFLSVPDLSGNDDNNLLVHSFRSNHIALWPLYAARDRILNEKQAVGAEEKSVSLGDAFCPGDQIERWQ